MKHLAVFKKYCIYGYIRCRLILEFDNVTINFKQIFMSTQTIMPNKTLVLLFPTIYQNIIQRHKFSHISSLFITFRTRFLYMTEEYFLKHNKLMLEWALRKESRHYILNGKHVDYGEDIEID